MAELLLSRYHKTSCTNLLTYPRLVQLAGDTWLRTKTVQVRILWRGPWDNMKYTKEILENLANSSKSFAEVTRKLGIHYNGGSFGYLKSRFQLFGIDFNHFTKQGTNDGSKSKAYFINRQIKTSHLVLKPEGATRTRTHLLKRDLLDQGVSYVCYKCGQLPEWKGKPLTLQIEHKNGKPWDNRQENLEFICPNCHTQTDTFGPKNKH